MCKGLKRIIIQEMVGMFLSYVFSGLLMNGVYNEINFFKFFKIYNVVFSEYKSRFF